MKDHWALDGRVEGSADGGHSQGAGGYRARVNRRGCWVGTKAGALCRITGVQMVGGEGPSSVERGRGAGLEDVELPEGMLPC